jgi:hypothetical protein
LAFASAVICAGGIDGNVARRLARVMAHLDPESRRLHVASAPQTA